MEIWKEIEGTYGLLEVSSEGRVRSLMRDGRILKAQPDKKRYYGSRHISDVLNGKRERAAGCRFFREEVV